MVQWLRLHISTAKAWVRSLIRKLRSQMHVLQPKGKKESVLGKILSELPILNTCCPHNFDPIFKWQEQKRISEPGRCLGAMSPVHLWEPEIVKTNQEACTTDNKKNKVLGGASIQTADQEQGSLQREGTWKGVSGMFFSPCCGRGLSSKGSSPHWNWNATILENGLEHCLHKLLLKNAGCEQGWHFSKRGLLKFSRFEKQMAKDGSLRKRNDS